MRIKGTPDMVVQTRKMVFGNNFAVVPLFKFDSEGYAEIDENKLSATDLSKIKTMFKVVDSDQPVVAQEIKTELSDEYIRKLAKEKGIKSWHTKSIKTLKGELNL